MVDQSYMLSRPKPPGAARQYFDQAVLPAAIDLAGTLEAGIERVAVLTRRNPALALAVALVAGTTLTAMLLRTAARGGRPRFRF